VEDGLAKVDDGSHDVNKDVVRVHSGRGGPPFSPTFSKKKEFGKIFEIPLIGRYPRRHDLKHLLDKVNERLSGFKYQHLSLAGRIITLSQPVIQSFPIYLMLSLPIIPKNVL